LIAVGLAFEKGKILLKHNIGAMVYHQC